MNKKGFLLSVFEMTHPGLMFVVGLLLGGFIMYFLLVRGYVPSNLI